MPIQNDQSIATLDWVGEDDGYVRLIDQTLLPTECKYIECRDVESVWEAIKQLRVRGAPAIGIAAAYGVCLGVQQAHDAAGARESVEEVCSRLATSRSPPRT